MTAKVGRDTSDRRAGRHMPFGFSLTARATEAGVRDLLSECRARLEAGGVPRQYLGMVELVWAEALNNVVEHAYAEMAAGQVSIEATVAHGQVLAHIRDNGLPFPGAEPPPGHLPSSDGEVESLPEGGFGWFLIRDLCERVEYRREDGGNRLTLDIRLGTQTT